MNLGPTLEQGIVYAEVTISGAVVLAIVLLVESPTELGGCETWVVSFNQWEVRMAEFERRKRPENGELKAVSMYLKLG